MKNKTRKLLNIALFIVLIIATVKAQNEFKHNDNLSNTDSVKIDKMAKVYFDVLRQENQN